MLTILACCAAMLLLTASTHYEALKLLNAALPPLPIPGRLRLLVLLIAVFAAHVLEMLIYALAYHLLPRLADVGTLSNGAAASFASCLYFSAETFTSLGFGDVTPGGPLRLLAGMEALNGLLLIGWSASYIHLAMERFWPVTGWPQGTATRSGSRARSAARGRCTSGAVAMAAARDATGCSCSAVFGRRHRRAMPRPNSEASASPLTPDAAHRSSRRSPC